MNIKSQEKLIRILFESGDNPVVTTEEDRFHLEDCIQYATKPGIIVATIKGDSESGIQQLPIGAVDSFRFMKVMDENAIINQEKNNGRSYDSILKEYEGQKNQIIQQWKKANLRKLEEVKAKYGNKFLGMDIVENQKQIQHKEEEVHTEEVGNEKKKTENTSTTSDKKQDIKEIDDVSSTHDEVNEGLFGDIKRAASYFKDNFGKNKELWNNVINDVKKEGNKCIQSLSKILIKLVDSRKDNGYMYLSDGDKKFLKYGTVMDFKGLQILCYTRTGNESESSGSIDDLENLLDYNNVKKLTDLDGIVVIDEITDEQNGDKKQDDSDKTVKSYLVNGVELDGENIKLSIDMENIQNKKDKQSRREKFG